jgi:hypothetical protein
MMVDISEDVRTAVLDAVKAMSANQPAPHRIVYEELVKTLRKQKLSRVYIPK